MTLRWFLVHLELTYFFQSLLSLPFFFPITYTNKSIYLKLKCEVVFKLMWNDHIEKVFIAWIYILKLNCTFLNSYRVLSYNILAKCFTDSNKVLNTYPSCSLEYLDSNYRRVLLTHEIKSKLLTSLCKCSSFEFKIHKLIQIYIDYNADIIFLQECDKSFQEDLNLFMADYTISFKYKSEHTKQGEAILIRSSRLK